MFEEPNKYAFEGAGKVAGRILKQLLNKARGYLFKLREVGILLFGMERISMERFEIVIIVINKLTFNIEINTVIGYGI